MKRSICLLVVLAACGCAPVTDSGVVAPVATVNTSSPQAMPENSISFSVPNMSCPHGCVAKVKETLAGLPGVTNVEVDFDSKTATCTLEKKDEFDSSSAEKALVEAGFDESKLKSS